MATAEQYADWIVRNQDKKGSKEFETVAAAYKLAKQTEAPAPAAAAAPTEIPAERQEGFFGRFLRRMGTVGPSAGMVDVSTTARLPQEALEEQAKQQAAVGLGFAAGPVLAAGTRAVGAAIPAVQRVTQALAPAFETGGFRTGLAATAPQTARLATRVVGAAAPGAIGGLPVDEAGTGAAVSTGVALVAPPVASVAAKSVGSLIDRVMGRTAATRANELVRVAANDQINALREAIKAAPDQLPSRIVANVAASSGQNLDVLQALLQRAEKADTEGVVNAFRQREAQDITNELARIAGGETSEAARATREGAKETLTAITAPIREQELAAARATGKIVPKLQTIATEARKGVTAAVDRVRRFTGAISSAEEWAKNWVASGGARAAAPRPPARFTFPGELAVTAERRAGEAAEESLQLGAKARAAEGRLAAMEAEGLKPITNESLVTRLNALLRNPEVATNREASAAIPRIIDMINDWTNQNGIVDPGALYAIRKNGVAGVIRELNPGMDAKSQSRFAAQVLSDVKPLIDDAIVQAGGRNWPAYLDSFEEGMSAIKGMELADQIRKLYKSGDKQTIVDLVRGESPDVIEDLFGSGRYKISEEMAKDMPFLRKLADSLQVDLDIVKQAAQGRAALKTAEEKVGWRIRLPFFTRFTTATNEIVAALEKKMKQSTMEQLIKAAQSGRDFERVLDAVPTRERSAFLSQFKNAESWSKFSTQVANAARSFAVAQTGEEPDVTVTKIGNRLIEQPNQNALRP